MEHCAHGCDRIVRLMYAFLQHALGLPADHALITSIFQFVVTVTIREELDLHLEFYQRDVTDGMPSLLKVPVDVVAKSRQEVFTALEKAKCRLLSKVCQPAAHAPNCSMEMSTLSDLRRV